MILRSLIAGSALLVLSACGQAAVEAGVDIPELDNAAWLETNAKARGVIVTESGLQYVVAQEGLENGASADPGQGIAAHYHGTFRDGSVFDSSYERGAPLRGASNGFISGWNEALSEMKVCEARTLYIKPELGYGDRQRGPIPANSLLTFHMQLLEVRQTGESEKVFKCPDDKVLSGPEAY